MSFFERTADRFFEWLFRPKPWPRYLIGSGIGLCMWSGAPFGLRALEIELPDKLSATLLLDTTPDWMLLAVFGLGASMGVVGLFLGTVDHRESARQRKRDAERRRCVVLEIKGLRSGPTAPLVDAVVTPAGEPKIPISIDVRDRLHDGKVASPVAAMEEVVRGYDGLRAQVNEYHDSDLTFVVGGLASVPLTFLLGLLLDDQSRVEFRDWDRHAGRWRALDGKDDGRRFEVVRSDAAVRGMAVSLCVSGSYRLDVEQVEAQMPNQPIVYLQVPVPGVTDHWSETKQAALGEEFCDELVRLTSEGVARIDLFLSGAASLVFRFGRLCDWRNVPEIRVYQYEPKNDPIYPWAVRMPSPSSPPQVVLASGLGPVS